MEPRLKRSPWGPVDQQETIAPGIVFVSTPSHGGIHLDRELQREFRRIFPQFVPFLGVGPWYEEDCDVQAVALAFPDAFPDQDGARAVARNVARMGSASWQSVVDTFQAK